MVSAGIAQRVAHARLPGEMHDVRESAGGEEPRGCVGLGEVEALEHAAGTGRERGRPRLLERDVVEAI